MCKELKEAGINCRVFESSETFGGVFARQFAGARMTSSNLTTAFSDFPHDPAHATIWTVEEYRAYLSRYVEHFGLGERIRFGTRVTRVAPAGDWEVTTESEVGRAFHRFDAVVVASGVHCCARMPEWQGLNSFTGTIMHSSAFRSADDFVGRRILVVGGGESAADIAETIGSKAQAACISIRRRAGHIVPRNLSEISSDFPDVGASDMDTCRAHHALPHWYGPVMARRNASEFLKYAVRNGWEVSELMARINLSDPHSSSQTRFGTKSAGFCRAIVEHGWTMKPAIRRVRASRVEFEDGSMFECDTIICATGFASRFEFLEQDLPEVARAASMPRANLYKHCVHPAVGPSLFFCGLARPAFGAIPPISEMQARWFVRLCTGGASLPSRKRLELAILKDEAEARAQFPHDAGRVGSLTDYLRMMDELAAEIGCKPNGWLLRNPKIWWRLLLGPICGAQYRLSGPQAKRDVAIGTLRRMPIRRANARYVTRMLALSLLGRIPGLRRCKLVATWP
jgi:dimethylaniline monooxygenase (N-oxide forming)